MLNKRDELLREISCLEKENEDLRKAIRKIDDKELFETVKIYTHVYRKCMYRIIPFSFLDTSFYYYKDILLRYANGCFINEILDEAYKLSQHDNMKELIMHIPMYCSNVVSAGNGSVLILTDPYRTIRTKPLKSINKADLEYYVGRILLTKLVIPENHRTVTNFELKELVPLKMSLTNIFGKNLPINNNTLLSKYKHITKETDAINAITCIENHFRSNKLHLVERVNERNLRVLTDSKSIGIWYAKEKLWYGEEPTTILSFYQTKEGHPLEKNIFNENNPFLFTDENLCSI